MGKDLKKQAVVIGATGNLGKAICKELAKNNFIIQEKWMKSNMIVWVIKNPCF